MDFSSQQEQRLRNKRNAQMKKMLIADHVPQGLGIVPSLPTVIEFYTFFDP